MYYNDACCTSERTLPFCKYTSKTVTLLGKKVLKTVLIYSHEHDLIWIETKPQRTNESKLYWLDARTRKRDLLSTDHHYRSSSYTEIMLMVLYLCIYLIATRDENRENDIFFQFAAVCCLLVFCFLLGHTMGNSCLSHFKFSFLFLASADKLGFKH